MSSEQLNAFTIKPNRPQQYPGIDIEPVLIQYWFAILIIITVNCILLYKFCIQVWKMYQQDQVSNIVHDIYDKNILWLSAKYIFVNILCIIYFHDITNPIVQTIKAFWIYFLAIVFMKFYIKQILWPVIILFCALTILSTLWIYFWSIFPVFKLILIQSSIIVYFGFHQAFIITKILKSYSKSKTSQISIQTLLQKNPRDNKNKHGYDEFTMGLQLDNQIISHLHNRRSFCIVFSIILILNNILYLNLQAGKELLGEVLLSLILHALPLYVVFIYLKKNEKERDDKNVDQSYSKVSRRFNQKSSQRTSKIVIQMVDIKR